MIKAYLDSYNKINVYVSKNYYSGKINSLYLSTQYGPVKLPDLVYKSEDKFNIEYYIEIKEEFELGKEYYLIDQYGFRFLLEYRYIVKDKRFIKETYTDKYLGCNCNSNKTSFSLWAPISSEVILFADNSYYKMIRENNVFRYEINKNLMNTEYYFLVKNNGKFNKVLDPYSYSYNFDQSASVAIDLDQIMKAKPISVSKESKVIYETSVRDFSSSRKIKYRGKFLGMIDSESLEYMDNLGIEYLQLMPINYFNGDVYNNDNFYNWGYNPNLFGVPHPNYVYNLEDSSAVVNECVEMVNKLHEKGIKVVIDVVFNHLEGRDDNNLNLVVPNYYYMIRNEKFSNGSYCGVDLDSKALMMKRLIKDMCKRWVKLYGIDGFRFDLMGILDCSTMNELYDELKIFNKDIIIYGEGWNMPSLMEENEKATIDNARKIRNIGLFNDYYRESLKYDYLGESVIKGDYANDGIIKYKFDQSINYLECHDNYTYYDLQKYIELRDEKFAIKRQLFKNLIILISNGYAFIHAGQEFFATKKGNGNSYCSLDDINTFDWNRLYKYNKEINLIEKMIKIREKYNLFSIDYKYFNENNLITLKANGIEIVINLSDKKIGFSNKEILLTTNSERLDKYDLVVYKSKGV